MTLMVAVITTVINPGGCEAAALGDVTGPASRGRWLLQLYIRPIHLFPGGEPNCVRRSCVSGRGVAGDSHPPGFCLPACYWVRAVKLFIIVPPPLPHGCMTVGGWKPNLSVVEEREPTPLPHSQSTRTERSVAGGGRVAVRKRAGGRERF